MICTAIVRINDIKYAIYADILVWMDQDPAIYCRFLAKFAIQFPAASPSAGENNSFLL
jgi:hypothetical protein